MEPFQLEVPPEKLRWRCDPGAFTFKTTDELAPLREFIGQERAIRAISFGLSIDQPGYNIFLTGLSGTGKSSIVKAHLESMLQDLKASGHSKRPSDWCYLHNFADGDHPTLVELPAGLGRQFKQHLERLLDEVRREVAQAFLSKDYEARRKGITQEAVATQQDIFRGLEQTARGEGFTVQFSSAGVAVAPLLGNRPASQEEYLQMEASVRQDLDRRRSRLMGQVEESAAAAREADKVAAVKVADLDDKVAEAAVEGPFRQAFTAFGAFPQLAAFLNVLKEFSVEHVDALQMSETTSEAPPLTPDSAAKVTHGREAVLAFSVNCFVDNTGTDGSPIIEESNPNFGNLFGRIERRLSMGAYVTDHTMLKPGSLQAANGGFLILDMRHIIAQPVVWEALKRVIKTKQVRPEDPGEAMGMVTPQVIKADHMPLDVKLVVTGDANLYNFLAANDEDFWEAFKVKADFDYQIRVTNDNLLAYSAFIAGASRKNRLYPFDAGAVGKVLEYSARIMSDQEKLSTRFGVITDLLIEADHWVRADKGAGHVVEARHVQRAIEEKVYRANLVEERMRDVISDGTVLVDVEGDVIGQVNGLAVLNLGDYSFGRPTRITARTFVGRNGVINIEREAQLSGKIHDKGVLIISGYIGWKYAQEYPLSVAASIAFEQSYTGVDGDSASSTEIYAILSSLSGVALSQCLAVTGSVNQLGEVQPIGGVNEKIEGFYDVCKALGLSGKQGVLIPKTNVRNLMLREDVLEAVKAGSFHVYAITTIDEGIELLTGMPAGQRGPGGKYQEGTINYLVDKQLFAYSQSLRWSALPIHDGSAPGPSAAPLGAEQGK
ncbi:MAG: peptidase lon-like protein [Dehalococcoidia bacterium]|nr:peptidase lon-like protein [Dehalococcoidia bacterium]